MILSVAMDRLFAHLLQLPARACHVGPGHEHRRRAAVVADGQMQPVRLQRVVLPSEPIQKSWR